MHICYYAFLSDESLLTLLAKITINLTEVLIYNVLLLPTYTEPGF